MMAAAISRPYIQRRRLQAASCLQVVLSLIEQRRQNWALPAELRIVVSYEAG